MLRFIECRFEDNKQGDGEITFTQLGVVTSLSAYDAYSKAMYIQEETTDMQSRRVDRT